AMMRAGGCGGPEVSGRVADSHRLPGTPTTAAAPAGSYPSMAGTFGAPIATPSRHSASNSTRPTPPPPSPKPSATMSGPGSALPPPGAGQLILGLDSAHRYVMTRTDPVHTPVPVAGLTAVAGAPAVLATNPAGGWVVALASKRTWHRFRPARLAVVAKSGDSVRFGPDFIDVTVTSAAVSLDGSRVAVAVAERSG